MSPNHCKRCCLSRSAEGGHITKSIDIRAMELFEQALDEPSDTRGQWVLDATPDDLPLRNAVLSLLDRDRTEAGIISTGQAMRVVSKDISTDIPDRIGGYLITRLIGEGGMGAVFEGRRDQDDFDLRVAIKVIKAGLLSDTLIERFVRERQVLANLNHPGIARLFDGGQLEDGAPYFVMEYVDGDPVTVFANRNNLSERERLCLFGEICEAVEYAHANLIIHRDITPSNVMVTTEGKVKLIDFGIAKPQSDDDLRAGVDAPSLDSLTFTPGYAAPERKAGAPANAAADVFSLGRLLQELLENTNHSPELAAILARATATSMTERYISVESLRSDVEAFQNNLPIEIYSGSRAYAAKKFFKRNPIPVLLGLALISSLSIGLATSLNFADKARKETAAAEERLAESEYFRLRADLFTANAVVLADTLERTIGSDDDIDRQTRILISRWETVYEGRKSAPATSAQVSLSLGRLFMKRHDYETARMILEPWVTEQYGPEILQNLGNVLLATIYRRMGEDAKAVPLYRNAAAWFAKGYENGSPDHINVAAQLAGLTEHPEDLADAVDLLETAATNYNNSPGLTIYYYGQLATLYETQGHFDKTIEATSSALKIVQDNPVTPLSGSQAIRLRVANIEFFRNQNTPKAQALLDEVFEILEVRGESQETGKAQLLQAVIYASQGNFDDANALSQSALEIIRQYSGEKSDVAIDALATRAEILAQFGDPTGAETLLDGFSPIEDTLDADHPMRTRILLARLFVNGPDNRDAPRTLSQANMDRINKSIRLTALHQRLIDADIVNP